MADRLCPSRVWPSACLAEPRDTVAVRQKEGNAEYCEHGLVYGYGTCSSYKQQTRPFCRHSTAIWAELEARHPNAHRGTTRVVRRVLMHTVRCAKPRLRWASALSRQPPSVKPHACPVHAFQPLRVALARPGMEREERRGKGRRVMVMSTVGGYALSGRLTLALPSTGEHRPLFCSPSRVCRLYPQPQRTMARRNKTRSCHRLLSTAATMIAT